MSKKPEDATARPWGVDINAGKPCIGTLETGSNGATWVDIGGPLYVSYDESGEWCVGLSEQDARLIVTAVNAYEPMLAALEAMLGRYVGLVNCGDCGHWNPETEDDVIAAREAIALAKLEGEKP